MRNVLLFCLVLGALKLCLLSCYVSTDFDVHRNWLAITNSLSLTEWYKDETSEWTLDYPPLFAYFEWVLAKIIIVFDSESLKLQAEPILNDRILFLQRLSVIISDVVFYLGCWKLSKALNGALNLEKRQKNVLIFGAFLVLVTNPGLILLDNLHFQYNSMLYGLFLIAVGFYVEEAYLKSAVAFSVLLNFKHINLYYTLALVGGFLFDYLLPINFSIVIRTALLGVSVILPCITSFGPFVYDGGIDQIHAILGRLFPFKRGLTHSYWAPNFWAFYNTLDFALYKVKSSFEAMEAPLYTNGKVQIYDHVVLPSITVPFTLTLVLLSSLSLLFVKKSDRIERFLSMLVLSSFSFFLFSWHVHEKAVLMIQIPLTILAFTNPVYAPISLLFTQASIYGLFPLFFGSTVENLVKYALLFAYVVIYKSLYTIMFNLNNVYEMKNKLFSVSMISLEVYKGFIHNKLLGSKADFLPLMLTSLLSAIVVHYTYIYLIYHFTGLKVWILKRNCLAMEKKIKESHVKHDCDDIKVIGAVDIQANNNFPSLAVISYTVMTYPKLKTIHHVDNVITIDSIYISGFLALREANVISKVVMDNSNVVLPDMLFVDGSASLHARGCGMGCHVEYQTGIPTVGVAKKMPFAFNEYCDDSESFNKFLKERAKSHDEVLDVISSEGESKVNVFKRNTKLFFVSSGLGTPLEKGTQVAAKAMIDGNFHPIRMCDLRARHLNENLLGNFALLR